MSNITALDFNLQLSQIDNEIESFNNSDANPKIIELFERAKSLLQTFINECSSDYRKLVSQLSSTNTFLESIGCNSKVITSTISYINREVNIPDEVNNTSNKVSETNVNNNDTELSDIEYKIQQTVRNSIDEIVNRVEAVVSQKFTLVAKQQHEAYSQLISMSLETVSTDIANQLSNINQSVYDQSNNVQQTISNTKSNSQPTLNMNNTPRIENNSELSTTMLEVGKVMQKCSKEISEQSSFMNNISHDIFSSITKLKKSFSVKSVLLTTIFSWILIGISSYFISSYIVKNTTKIADYQQEHQTIQNLKDIRQNLDPDGQKCWNKIFSK